MNVAAFIHWAGKGKNGGLDADEARAKWESLAAAEGAITDLLGPTAKLARRVAIRTKDLVILRDQQERSRIQ